MFKSFFRPIFRPIFSAPVYFFYLALFSGMECLPIYIYKRKYRNNYIKFAYTSCLLCNNLKNNILLCILMTCDNNHDINY